jgi:hypothetical protein
MAKHVLIDPVITIDGTNLTNMISQVDVDMPDDEVDVTGFGSRFKETEKGLSDASIGLNAFQNFALASVDAVLWPLKSESKKFIAKVQAKAGEISNTNPCYVIGGKLFNYKPLAGSVGEASTTDPTIKNQTQLGVVRCKSAAEVVEKEAAITALF